MNFEMTTASGKANPVKTGKPGVLCWNTSPSLVPTSNVQQILAGKRKEKDITIAKGGFGIETRRNA